MGSTNRALADGTIAQGMAGLAATGDLAMPAPLFQPELVGNTHSYYPTKARGYMFGKRTNLGNVLSTLWGGPTALYQFPPAPMQMQLVSGSANDTANGTGIRQVQIHYLDHNYAQQSMVMTLNGTTPVLTVPTDILRINAMHAIAVGSNIVGFGPISLQSVGGSVTYGYIYAGDNTARQAVFTVPAGLQGYINHWQASSGSPNAHFCQTIIAATTHDGINYPGVFLLQDEQGTQNGGVAVTVPVPISIPPMVDVQMAALGDASNAGITAIGAVMGWFEPVN